MKTRPLVVQVFLGDDILPGDNNKKSIQLSNEKNGCLGYKGDQTTQLYSDYNKPL